jgi:hypothetical protein
LRVRIPTREIGDVVGKVGGRPWKVERDVEEQKEFSSGRMDGRMEMALKAKRLSSGRRFADLQRRRLRWRGFRAGFAFSLLDSREMRDKSYFCLDGQCYDQHAVTVHSMHATVLCRSCAVT